MTGKYLQCLRSADGKFAFEQPIREQKLAERFGTSRGPVRDALLRLTQEGVWFTKPKGYA